MRKTTSLIFFLFITFLGFSQQKFAVQGNVKDTKKSPLEGVSIIIENTSKGTITDSNGSYLLQLPNGEHTLVFSYMGYKTQKKKIVINNADKNVNTVLKEDEFTLNEVVVTGYENNRSILETAGAISKIRPLELNRGNNIHISQVMNNIPGVLVDVSNPGGQDRISIRGGLYRYTHVTSGLKVYWNDLPMTGASGSSPTEMLNPNIMSSIEVIKGSSGNVYGSGTGGVILFKSELPNYQENSIQAGTLIGKFGLLRTKLGANISTENSRLNIGFTDQKYDGYRPHNETALKSLSVTGQFKTGRKGKLSVFAFKNNKEDNRSGHLTKEQFEKDPFAYNQGAIENDYGISINNLLFGASYRYEMLKNLTTTIGGTVITRKYAHPGGAKLKNGKWSGGYYLGKDVGYTVRGKLDYTPKIFDQVKTKFTVGLETLSNDILKRSYTKENGKLKFSSLGGEAETASNHTFYFGQVELDFPNDFFFTIGGSYNTQNYDIIDFYDKKPTAKDESIAFDIDPVFSPRVSLTKKFDNISVYASASKGFSPPRSGEISSGGVINSKLKPEQGVSYELGTRGNVLDYKLFYDIALYQMNTDDVILRKKVDGATVYYNGGDVNQKGIEATLKYNAITNKGGIELLNFWTSYTYQDYDVMNNNITKKMAGIAPHSFNVGFDIKTEIGFYGNTTFNYRDKKFAENANEIVVDSYNLLNARLGYKKTFLNRIEADVFVGGNNLFDTIWVSYVNLNNRRKEYFGLGEPRAFYTGLNVKYKF